jgi:hypothetical protein
MFDDLTRLDDALFQEIQEAVHVVIKQLIDERANGPDQRRLLSVIAGKALIVSGSSFIGAAMRLPHQEGLAPGMACLAEFKRIAKANAAK